MKFLIPLVLASTCLAISEPDPSSSELDPRIDDRPPLCSGGVYHTKQVCKTACGPLGRCFNVGIGPRYLWECKCQPTAATEADLSKRVAVSEPEAEADAMPNPGAEEDSDLLETRAEARCTPAIYSTKAVCKNHCGRRGTCHKTTAGHPVYWQCKCPRTSATEEDLSKRVAEPEAEPNAIPEPLPEAEGDILDSRAEDEADKKCVPGIYGMRKSSCTPHCHGRGRCLKAAIPHFGILWECNCPVTSATEGDLTKRDAEPDAMPKPVVGEDTVAEDLAKRAAEPAPEAEAEAEADALPIPEPEDEDNDDDGVDGILESRADIEARARCVPGSYGKRKKSCTPHCKGRGKCQTASSPGIGFVWVCVCPT